MLLNFLNNSTAFLLMFINYTEQQRNSQAKKKKILRRLRHSYHLYRPNNIKINIDLVLILNLYLLDQIFKNLLINCINFFHMKEFLKNYIKIETTL